MKRLFLSMLLLSACGDVAEWDQVVWRDDTKVIAPPELAFPHWDEEQGALLWTTGKVRSFQLTVYGKGSWFFYEDDGRAEGLNWGEYFERCESVTAGLICRRETIAY